VPSRTGSFIHCGSFALKLASSAPAALQFLLTHDTAEVRMFSVALFGSNTIDGGALEAGERVVSLALFGGMQLDFSGGPPPPALELVLLALFGGVKVKVRPAQDVRLSGFSLFGGRDIEPRRRLPAPTHSAPTDADDDAELPLEIRAYALFGGVSVQREPAEPAS
jgi:hypothetical protein